jgi:hypothetical protein
MSKLLMIVGILLAALGVTVALMLAFAGGQMQVYGITPEVAALLIVGGFVTLGLGGVVDAVASNSRVTHELQEKLARPEAAVDARLSRSAAAAGAAAAGAAIATEAGRATEAAGRAFEAAKSRVETAGTAVKSDAEQMIAEARRAAAETSAALDQAKAEIEEALSPREITIPPGAELTPEEPLTRDESRAEYTSVREEVVVEAAPESEPEEEQAEDQLYVVEERMIRGRPARVLSDGTVEAETDEGWMRFENLDHLEEYLEAMSPSRA